MRIRPPPRSPRQPRRRSLAALLAAALLSLAPSAPTLATEPAADADPHALDRLLAALAQPTPSHTAFVELRQSGLLSEPLRLSGQLRHPAADTLVREVRAPYRERTTIRAERVQILRDGDGAAAPYTRTFSLRRAPELGALLASFGALLTEDRTLLERHYSTTLHAGAARWTLRLVPRDARLRERVTSITLHGALFDDATQPATDATHGDRPATRAARGELQCMQLTETDGDTSLTLLGAAADAATDITDPAALAALCLRGVAQPTAITP